MAENEPDEGLRDAARDALIDPSTQPTQPAAAEPEATTEPSADEATEE
jgi:hypothetical protein